jgi:hypothetical protein
MLLQADLVEEGSMARRRTRQKRGRRQRQEDAEAPSTSKQGFVRRHATVLGIVVAVLALIISAVALWPAFVSNQVLQHADLQIADLKVTTKHGVALTDYSAGKEIGKGTTDAAAVSIVLRNSGEEPAFINRLRAKVNRVWIPPGCFGGGPLITSIAYDFILPGDLDVRPRPEPIVLNKDVQFKVDGKALDSLAVTIGQEQIGEVGWPWITAANVALIEDNGDTIETDPFVLMDGYRVDDLLRLIAFQVDRGQGQADRACLNKTVGVLEEALAAPGKKSSAIGELRDRLNRLGFQAHPRFPTSPQPSDDASDTWIAQLASLPRNTSAADLERNRAEIAAQIGLEVRVLYSSDFASLTPGYWVIYHPGPFADGYQALEYCRAHGRDTEQLCVGRYLSHVEQHRDLVCRFSEPPDSRRCTRN